MLLQDHNTLDILLTKDWPKGFLTFVFEMIKRCRMKERFRMKNGSNEIAYILRGLKFAPIKTEELHII